MVYTLENILTSCLSENTKGINLGLTQHKGSKSKLLSSPHDTAAITLSGTWVALNAWIEHRLSKQKVRLNLFFYSFSYSLISNFFSS